MREPADILSPEHYESVRRPPESAAPLPNWCYTSAAFYAAEVERIFSRAWNFVGHASQIPVPGDYLTREIAGISIIVMRGDDAVVRAFYNACRHRGSRIASGEGTCRRLTCPYHAWSYGRDGRLLATPLIEEDGHLRHADLALLAVRLESWAGFLFANFDHQAAPLGEWLGDMVKSCSPYGPERMVCTRRKTYRVAANWKLHFENFNDSLHIPFVHRTTLYRQQVSGRRRSTHEQLNGQCLVHFTAHEGSRGLLEGESGFPPIESLEGRYTGGTFYPCVLPATMMAWTIDSMFLFDLMPTGPQCMEIAILSFFPEDRVERDDFEALAARYYHRLDVILPEDNRAVEAQQLGLQAPVHAASRFTHMETLCHAFDNWVLDRVLDSH